MSVRTAVSAVSAASLALLLTACGSDTPDAKPKGDNDAAASASAAAKPDVKALTAAELEKLVLGQPDAPGYLVKKAGAADIVNAGDVGADKAACEPLAEAMSGVSTGTPGASAMRKAVQAKKGTAGSPDDVLNALAAPVTAVTLGSYGGQGAQQAIGSLKAASTACGEGFTVSSSGEKTKVTKVTPLPLTAGEEAVAFTVVSDMEGTPFTSTLAVFRKGNNLATFSTISVSGKVKGLPQDLVDAQAAKLR
ncbi:hypothetical protein [Streptomyces sp. NPDC048659]|uniref:hypothetical protein n=1 Tax=Streptomyces sp. NPDC048659 TaxID=3155489 RepID=UPI003437F0C9